MTETNPTLTSQSGFLVAGAYYETRAGEKVGPLRDQPHSTRRPWFITGMGSFDIAGHFNGPYAHPYDLLKRIDPPTSQSESTAGEIVKRLDELKKLAKAATPGPWCVNMEPDAEQGVCSVPLSIGVAMCEIDNDEAFIAAANPATVLYLLALIDAQSRAIEAARAALEPFARLIISPNWRDDERRPYTLTAGHLRAAAAAVAALPKGDV